MQTHEAWSLDFLKRYLDISDDTTIQLIYNDYILKTNMTGTMHQDWMSNALPSVPATTAQATIQAVFLVPPSSKKHRRKT
jgi:hypothetical protein